MRILLLNANRVGIGTYHRARYFGRELQRRGHDVTLMTVSLTERVRARTSRDSDGLRIIECPNWGDEWLPWHASGPIDLAYRIRELWTGNYDVVYAFEYQPNVSIPVLLAKPFKRFTLISDWCDWHAGAAYHFGGKRWAHAIDRYCEEFIRHRAHHVTTINRTLHERAVSIGIDRQRVSIVGEGVDPSYIVPGDRDGARRSLGLPDGPIVGTIRDATRSAELLCEAIARSSHDALRLLVIGSHPDEVESVAEKHGVRDRVLLPGRVSDDDLPRYLATADVLALPLEDNLVNRGRWPHKLGDMLAARRPVVVSRGGEFPQLLEQRACAVVADYTAMSFRDAIDAIIEAPEAFTDVAERGRALIESELNWDVIGAEVERVVIHAVERRSTGCN